MAKYSEEAEQILHLIKDEILKGQRPSNEIILDDIDLQNFLKCSKRKTAQLREKGIITYMKPEGRVYYKLSDVLKYLERSKVEAIVDRVERRFKT